MRQVVSCTCGCQGIEVVAADPPEYLGKSSGDRVGFSLAQSEEIVGQAAFFTGQAL